MSAIIEIECSHTTASGSRYRVWHDGSVLLESCRDPLTDGARALVKRGVTGRVQMKRVGSSSIDMHGLIAVLATRTISEGQTSIPRFAKWAEFDAALQPATDSEAQS
jgi:hypothetical protein